jgi:hypothetical protein
MFTSSMVSNPHPRVNIGYSHGGPTTLYPTAENITALEIIKIKNITNINIAIDYLNPRIHNVRNKDHKSPSTYSEYLALKVTSLKEKE